MPGQSISGDRQGATGCCRAQVSSPAAPWLLNCSLLAFSVSIAMALPRPSVAADDGSSGRPASAQPLFKQLDSNGDGLVTSNEVPDARKKLFDRLVRLADKNGDQKLDQDEFVSGLAKQKSGNPQRGSGGGDQPGPLERFKRLDANGDGKIALDEVPEPVQPFFTGILDQFDEDADDALSLPELKAALPALRERFQQFTPNSPDANSARSGGHSPLLSALDKNRDGALDADEVANAALALKALDADGDGTISTAELTGQSARRASVLPNEAGERPNRAAALWERLKGADKNGDGKLSRDEAPPRLKERFDRLDQNRDGLLEQKELQDRFSRTATRQSARQGRQNKSDSSETPSGKTADSDQ